MNEQLRDIREQLKRQQDAERFEHSIGVMYTAASLAMRYDYDVEKAMLAGLLHDCAKCLPNEQKIEECRQRNIPISDVEYQSPFLLHAKLGAAYAAEKFHVCDVEILHAIQYHTTGCVDMSLLDKIIYVADYMEPNRTKGKRLGEIRKMAYCNLNECITMILQDNLAYLEEKDFAIDPLTEQVYKFYSKEQSHE